MQWAHLSWRDSEGISEKWATHFQSSHHSQRLEYELDSCDVTLASKDGVVPLHSSFSTTSSHLPPSAHNQASHFHVWELASTPAPPTWVPSVAQFATAASTFNNTSDDNNISFVHVQHHHRLYQFHVRVLSPACLIRLQLQPLPLHFLHTSIVFHQTAYWVAPLRSTRSPIVTYLTVMSAFHVVAKGFLSLEHPKGWLDEINIWLIDWLGTVLFYVCPPPLKMKQNSLYWTLIANLWGGYRFVLCLSISRSICDPIFEQKIESFE